MYPGGTLSDDLTIYSSSFPREADNLIAVFQVMDVGATGSSVTVKAYTKNSADASWPAAADTVGTTATLDTAGAIATVEAPVHSSRKKCDSDSSGLPVRASGSTSS